jgi:hypothetical protein
MIKKLIISLIVMFLLPGLNAFANTDAKIKIDMEYIVVSPGEQGTTLIMDMVSYKNMTSVEYKGDGTTEGVLSVTLPRGASNLTMLDSSIQYKQTADGFVTTTPIPANGSVVLPFTYQMKEGQDIVLTFNMPIDSYQILVPEGAGSIEFKDAEYTSQGLMDIDDKKFWGYTVSNIQANQTVTIAYDKNKQPSGETQTAATNSNASLGNVTKKAPSFHNPGHLRMWAQSPLRKFNPHVLLIVLGVIVIAGVSYYSYFQWKNSVKKRNSASDEEEKAFQLLMAKQKAIMDKILELEDSFERGQISESDYHAKLEAYKQHLVKVKLSLNEFVE